jgi:hypothetical protein
MEQVQNRYTVQYNYTTFKGKPKPAIPTYTILETVFERIYKKTWYKLDANRELKYIIANLPGENLNWEYVKENNGAYYYWVTDQTLTLLQIQGAVEKND